MASGRLQVVVFTIVVGVAMTLDLPYATTNDMDIGAHSYVKGTSWTRLFFATPDVGTYNMSPMLGMFNGVLLATWKNAPQDEDQAGQRVLYAQSTDGVTWTNGTREIFPNMSTSSHPAHLFAEPLLHINGRAYAAASPTQFCLYPDQYGDQLLLREVLPGLDSFGPVFWASEAVPAGFEEASTINNVVTVTKMPSQVYNDIAMLRNQSFAPCDDSGETSKCEYCKNGCQDWNQTAAVPGLENERAHYLVPSTDSDVLLYRSYLNKKGLQHNYLYASVRENSGASWSLPARTNITNDVSNLNAGNLADGRAWLVNNRIFATIARNPLHLSVAKDGLEFVKVGVLANCEHWNFKTKGQPLGCLYRHAGRAKQGGCQYPQSMVVNDIHLPGFYTVFSLNKEDIWIAHTPLNSL